MSYSGNRTAAEMRQSHRGRAIRDLRRQLGEVGGYLLERLNTRNGTHNVRLPNGLTLKVDATYHRSSGRVDIHGVRSSNLQEPLDMRGHPMIGDEATRQIKRKYFGR